MSAYEELVERVQVKVTANRASEAVAKAIVEISDDLSVVVRIEVARVVSEEIGKVLSALHEAKTAIEANPRKSPRRYVLRWIENLSNRLSVVSAGYAAGSLPKVKR